MRTPPAANCLPLYLSLPDDTRPVTEARVIGDSIEDRFGGYDTMDHAVFRRHEILLHAIPSGWEPGVTEETNRYLKREYREPYVVPEQV